MPVPTPRFSGAISKTLGDDSRWAPATGQNGEARPGAAVCELPGLVDLADWPDGTRLIVRRECLHPGAQQTLFPSLAYRYWGHYTDVAGDPVTLDVHMRGHAHVEDYIGRLKDSGLQRFPFTDLAANRAWLAVVCFAVDLFRWFQLLCLAGPLAAAPTQAAALDTVAHPRPPRAPLPPPHRSHPRRLPTAGELLAAYRRIALIT